MTRSPRLDDHLISKNFLLGIELSDLYLEKVPGWLQKVTNALLESRPHCDRWQLHSNSYIFLWFRQILTIDKFQQKSFFYYFCIDTLTIKTITQILRIISYWTFQCRQQSLFSLTRKGPKWPRRFDNDRNNLLFTMIII